MLEFDFDAQLLIEEKKINENQISAFLKNALKGIVYLQ